LERKRPNSTLTVFNRDENVFVSGLPFDDIRDLIANLPPMDERAAQLACDRSEDLNQRFGFGDHEAMLCEWLAGWSGKSPSIARPMIALFAGTHSVAAGQANIPGEETLESVTRLAAGGAPVNQVCAVNDIGLKVFDLALQYPVADITTEDALDEKGCAATIGFGMEAIAGGVDLLGLCAFGKRDAIANAAILHLLHGLPVETFLNHLPLAVAEKCGALARDAAELHAAAAQEPLELLRRLGGREHAALTGAILAARINHVPVVLDGKTAICVSAILERMEPQAVSHCLFVSGGVVGTDNDDSGNHHSSLPVSAKTVLSGFHISNDASTAGHAIALLKSVATLHTNTVIEA
jgi:nicotinate-nucleotide--dimethylbenzimidazole phosphoribosyltransferase